MSSTLLMDKAIEFWNKGQDSENAKDYPQAIGYYKQGCEYMMNWLKYDKIESRKQNLKNKMCEYIKHCEELKGAMNSPKKVEAESANGGGSAGKS